MRHLLVLGIFFILSGGPSKAQAIDNNYVAADLPQAFQGLAATPQRLPFVNSDFEVYTKGGHVQGIQYYRSSDAEYVVISGSSDKAGYYVMVDLGKARLVRYNKIDITPYDHAGGFQLVGDFMVIGVEDNLNKDASKIVFYNLSKPGESDLKPTHTILRGKAFKSKTAGAVGISQYRDHHLMAVLSWDAATVDFYKSNGKPIRDSAFEMSLVYTWLPVVENKKDWSSSSWSSYQAVSLFAGANDNLYLFGFARKGFQDVADLFEVQESQGRYSLQKIGTRQFKAGKYSFRYGAGMSISSQGKLFLYATPYRLRKKNVVARFGPKTTD